MRLNLKKSSVQTEDIITMGFIRNPLCVLLGVSVVALMIQSTQAEEGYHADGQYEVGKRFSSLVQDWYRRSPQKRVVGGGPAIPNSWPWQARLCLTGTQQCFCGGSLISHFHVITAAHCFFREGGPMIHASEITLVFGDHVDLVPEGVEYQSPVRDYAIHPGYNLNAALDLDVAIIRLPVPVPFTHAIQPVPLPATPPLEGSICVTSGWGNVVSDMPSPSWVLKNIQMTIQNLNTCQRENIAGQVNPFKLYTPNMICAENDLSDLGHGPCFGDSGGPLVCRHPGTNLWQLQGIVSHGGGDLFEGIRPKTCDARVKTAIFTDVYAIQGWITQMLNTIV